MKIRVAQRAGFCWGVRRAMDTALESSVRFGHREPVQTLGPLIHNPQALDHLSRRGIREIDQVSEVRRGSIVIRAHGVPLEDLNLLAERRRRREVRIQNGTCPEVARVQSMIHRHATRGGFVIILGQPNHAEVLAHRSFAMKGCAVIQTPEEVDAIPDKVLPGALVVAQTTFSVTDFNTLSARLQARCPSIQVRETICPDTYLRQQEARSLAASSDTVVVVGGKASNNTRHLVETAREVCPKVHWVESAQELAIIDFKQSKEVAVLAGASTPNWTVEEAIETLEAQGKPQKMRWLFRLFQSLHLSEGLLFGALTAWLQHHLGWPSAWAGFLLMMSFHLALFSFAPYLDPLGLDVKGQIQGRFYVKFRTLFWGIGSMAGVISLLAATTFGLITWIIVLVSGALVLGIHHSSGLRTIRFLPGSKDIGLSLLPVWLGIGVPLLQRNAVASSNTVLATIVLFSFALALHALRNLRAFREDRVLGREILSVAIGSRATKWLAVGLLIISLGSAWRVLR